MPEPTYAYWDPNAANQLGWAQLGSGAWLNSAPTYTPRRFVNAQGQEVMASDPYKRTLFTPTPDEPTYRRLGWDPDAPTPQDELMWAEGNPLSGYVPFSGLHQLMGVQGKSEYLQALKDLGAFYDPEKLNNDPTNLTFYVPKDKEALAREAMNRIQVEQTGLGSGIADIAKILGAVSGAASLGSALAGGNGLFSSITGAGADPSGFGSQFGTANTGLFDGATAAGSGTAAAGSAGGSVMPSLTDAFTASPTSQLSAALSNAGFSDAQIADIFSGVNTGSGTSLPSLLGDSLTNLGANLPSAGLTGGALTGGAGVTPSLFESITGALGTNLFGSGSSGITLGNLLGTGSNLLGGYLQGNAARDAAQTASNAQLEAARIAADAAKFRPVGVTTRFGTSNFTKDANGNVIGAGYTLDPAIKAQQDALLAASGNALTQATGAQSATAPMGAAAQSLFGLGQGYLTGSPQEQAAKYMADQQALLAASREAELARIQNRLQAQGRGGLMVGGGASGALAANPELNAYYNSLRQQDLGLAANATQGGMDYAKFGAGLVGTGGDMLKSMYGVQTAAFDPYSTLLGGAQRLEGLGQNAMDLGVNLGRTTSNAASGQLLAQGMQNAAQTMQPANAWSPWAGMLGGASNLFQSLSGKGL